MSETLLSEALNFAQAINDERYRTQALVGLIEYLAEDLLRRALSIADSIWDNLWWAEARARLAPYMPDPLRTEMLEEAMRWLPAMDYYKRAKVLAGLAPHLPESLLGEALVAAQTLGESDLIDALPPLAARLPEPMLGEMLNWVAHEVGRTIDICADQVLTALAPWLSKPQVYHALEIADSIGNTYARMRALIGLSSLSPRDQLELRSPGRSARCSDAGQRRRRRSAG